MATFHPLEVREVRRETRDAVVLTLEPRPEHRDAFRFIPGQYLTFRRTFDGEELRRSYSICAGRGEPIRVGVKRVEGGAFSTWANEALAPGEVLEAMPPMGAFHAAVKPDEARRYLLFAGGSGITPVLGILRTVMAEEPLSAATLVYGNRSPASIMFREEIEDLKNQHLGRLSTLHILESDQEVELFTGRIDREKCAALFERWIDVAGADLAFICGPEPMMLAVSDALKAHGLSQDRIRIELFASGQGGRAKRSAAPAHVATGAPAATAVITLDGVTRSAPMPKSGQTLLEAALAADLDAPYACKAGVCSTCRAMVLEGEVEMAQNYALEDYEVRQGYVLTCQCTPVSDRVVVTYDR